ncbi:LysR family transcriptional regulator (plasmid) [Roseomonas gilardii subsp. gilardii]|uniref:LysR family transcriptional regulator n=1 Tax=Roseomonas gilardii TaxID=257708 RepID=UPI001FF84581|nr:LysR family transcriptional regulator [Roseomonas gilardii]UPG74706.1 LysR family transcriptional regulator [Roseomonas gilardii subsp. gilardii]
MNTRFLATLVAIAETGSLAGAARHLNLANASVREQIQSLERDLAVPLLVRRGRALVLTEAGQAVLDQVRDILSKVDDLKHIVQLGKLRGQLRVGSISTALTNVVPQALKIITERHPSVEIKVVPGTSAHLYRRLEHGELDCVLMVQPPFGLPKGMTWHEIRREPLTLFVPSGNRLRKVDEALRSAPLIRMDRDAWTGHIVTSYLKDRNLSLPEIFEMDALEAIIILVGQGLGVTLLPDWGVRGHAASGVRKIPVDEGRYYRSVGLVAPRGPRDSLILLLVQALREGLSEQPSPAR